MVSTSSDAYDSLEIHEVNVQAGYIKIFENKIYVQVMISAWKLSSEANSFLLDLCTCCVACWH